MKYGEVTLGQVEAAINKLGGYKMWRRFLKDEVVVRIEEPEGGAVGIPEQLIYPVTIPYGEMSFEEMKAEMGCDIVHPDITEERFPLVGRGTVEENLVPLDLGRISAPDAFKKIEALGYHRPRDIAVGFRFAAKYPGVQRLNPVVVPIDIRSDHCGRGVLPVLYGDAGYRLLGLSVAASGWYSLYLYRWLVARTEQPLVA